MIFQDSRIAETKYIIATHWDEVEGAIQFGPPEDLSPLEKDTLAKMGF